MSLGDFPLGYGIAGADPVYRPTPPVPVLARRAVVYNPSIKQWMLLDANGNQVDCHPVDQIVAVRLTASQGQSASSPSLGTRIFARWQLAQPSQYLQIATAEVTLELKDLITAGDVKLVSVAIKTTTSGANVVVPTYVNLRDPKTSPLDPLASTTSAPPITLSP